MVFGHGKFPRLSRNGRPGLNKADAHSVIQSALLGVGWESGGGLGNVAIWWNIVTCLNC